MSEKPVIAPKHLFGPLWGARALTRVLPAPDWLLPAHIPSGAIPRERRVAVTSKTDRVFWKSNESAGLRAHAEDVAWTLDGLRGIQLYADTTGGGWVELRLLWTSIPDWATLIVHEPWSEADRARFQDLGIQLAKLLSVTFEA